MQGNMVIGRRLKELCKEKNVTYQELGDKIGMPAKRIYRLANGMHSNPGVFTMLPICDGLGVTLDEFFGPEEFRELWEQPLQKKED